MYRFPRSNTVEVYGLNAMSLFKSYWTVQGISPDARKAAVRAADANGEELGVWLSRLINKVSLAERNAVTVAEDSVEHTVEDSVEDTVEDSVEETVKDTDDKLSSIERAMQQSRTTGDVESA